MKLTVEGMTCQGCVKSVTRVIARQTDKPEDQIHVSLEQKSAEFDGDADSAKLIEALAKAGFTAKTN